MAGAQIYKFWDGCTLVTPFITRTLDEVKVALLNTVGTREKDWNSSAPKVMLLESIFHLT